MSRIERKQKKREDVKTVLLLVARIVFLLYAFGLAMRLLGLALGGDSW